MEDDIYQVRKTKIIKIENNKTYQENFLRFVKDVLFDDMMLLMKLFLDKAAVNMGKECYDAPEATKNSIMEFLYKEFRWLPVYSVGSAIMKGSLDDKSSTRLIPRTVRKWLNDGVIEFRRNTEHKEHEELFKDNPIIFDLRKYPIGKAIAKKIDWYNAGLLDGDAWDKVDLKKLSEAIARKENVIFENFYYEQQ